MKRLLSYVLDDFVSPKIVAGPHASAASRPFATAVRDDPQYRELVRRLRAVGFFDAAPLAFAWRIPLFALLYLGAFAYLLTAPGLVPHAIACAVIGFAHVHGNFIAHDAGHGAITRSRRAAEVIGQLFDTLLGGYSFTYFRRVHDLHHYHCNEVDRDPNTMSGLFALHDRAAGEKTALTRATTRAQHVLIPLLSPLWGFALRGTGIAYVIRNWRKARVDAVLLLGHFALWFALPVHYLGWWSAALTYVAVTACASVYLSLIILVNHLGMPAGDAGPATARSFIAQQVTTSRNLPSSPVRDFLFIGQNAQIEHHLFPWGPTCNLRRGREVVRELCREYEIPYHECSYLDALREVHHHLARIARQAAAIAPLDGPARARGADNLRRAS